MVEPWAELVTASFMLLGVLYFAITAREFSLQAFRENLLNKYKTKLYKKACFDHELYEQIS